MRPLRPVAAAMALSLACACGTRPPLEMELLAPTEDGACRARAGGEVVRFHRVAALVRERRPGEAHIRGSVEVPYRCVGDLIGALRQAGVDRIGFISEPAAEE